MRGVRARAAPQGGRRRGAGRPDPHDRQVRHRALGPRALHGVRASPDRPDARRRGARKRVLGCRLRRLRRRGGRPARDRAPGSGEDRAPPSAARGQRRAAQAPAAGPRLLGGLSAVRGAGARLGGRGRRAVAVRLGVRARRARPRRAHRRALHRAAAAWLLRRDRHGRRHRAPAPAGRGAGPNGRPAWPRRRRVDGAAGRGQRRGAAARQALVVGDPHPRAVLHARLDSHAARGPRLGGARDRDVAEGVQRSLLPRARRRLLAAGRAGARARRAGGAPRRSHVGAGLPRPDGRDREGASP